MKAIKTYHLLILFGAFLLLSSCTERKSILGHWKCDSSGTMTAYPNTNKEQSGPVTEFYDGLSILPLEMEFRDDGIMIWHSRKKDESYQTREAFYFTNYKEDENKVIIRDCERNEEDVITIKSISSSQMTITYDPEDDVIFDLVMNKIK